MRAISLFSGVGGFEVGFERAGIQTVLQAEQDPWCLAVLARHWPETERLNNVESVDAALLQQLGDDQRRGFGSSLRDADSPVTRCNGRVRQSPGRDIDLIYGGFPCQDVSVAGKRAGFSGARSGLWHAFRRVLREVRPPWTVIENVPGLLSSNRGRDFTTLLVGLEELGYGWAYRILDARHFGVAQRRRRVFIVGRLGDARRAAQVLAVCQSCGGHPAASREAGERPAFSLSTGSGASRSSHGNAWNTDYVTAEPEARALLARASGYRGDWETENYVVAGALRASDGHHGHSSPRGDGGDNLIAKEGVRRLTPLECERLMGWPDYWTRYTADGREIPDSHRYRMCGNGVVGPVAEWLGHRLMAVT